MKLTREKVNYVNSMSKELIKSLKEILKYYENNNDRYLYSSENRAKFKRLRVELTKELMQIQRVIY